MLNKINRLKFHVYCHRAKYSSALTATAFIALMMRNAKELNEFLEAHDLLEAYYFVEE